MRIVSNFLHAAVRSEDCFSIRAYGQDDYGGIELATATRSFILQLRSYKEALEIYKQLLDAEGTTQKIFYVPDIPRTHNSPANNNNSIFELNVKI